MLGMVEMLLQAVPLEDLAVVVPVPAEMGGLLIPVCPSFPSFHSKVS